MMRWPASSVAPCAARNDRTKDTVVAGSSTMRPSATTAPPFATDAAMDHGSTPGTSSPKTTPRWKTLPARIASRSSKGRSRSTSSSAGASPATPPSAPTRIATSTSTAGAVQPVRSTTEPAAVTPVSTR